LRYLAGFVDLERGRMSAATLGLDRIRRLLAALGDPQLRYPSVLIAGTNGKGSTAAMVERALRAAGYRTGLYTQPHLHTLRERVRIDGAPTGPDAFAFTMADVRAALEGDARHPTTAYEAMTALALQAFARERVEVAVLEVGLGGRLDATNAVEAAVSAITPISLDHTEVLGDTVAALAREKADIIKNGRPAVSAPQAPEAMAVLRDVARRRGAQLAVAGEAGARWMEVSGSLPFDGGGPRDEGRPNPQSPIRNSQFGGRPNPQSPIRNPQFGGWGSPSGLMELVTAQGRLVGLQPALRGSFQQVNIAVAATILDVLAESGLARLDPGAVRAGIEDVSWPGRFEVLPGEPTTVIDGAHNVDGARRLREALDEAYPGAGVVLVLGIAADKDIPGVVAALCRGSVRVRAVVATRADHPRAAEPEIIAACARTEGAEAVVCSGVAAAIDAARVRASAEDVVAIAGSLYVVGEAREALGLAESSGEAAFNPWGAR
jgi:dihydrofolate synthase/folylpolyglutamate synthase